ncbi:MAG: DUF433 domain-containing protein [Gemmatimonadales bacterium]
MAKYRSGPFAGQDPRQVPAYGLAEAARYLRLPSATLRSWVVGRAYAITGGSRRFQPLIRPADPKGPNLSFLNLIEAHVLRALRQQHRISIRDVRTAIGYAQDQLGIENLLLDRSLLTDGKDLFLERYGELLSLSRTGQIFLRRVLEDHLARIDWDTERYPVRLYPFTGEDHGLAVPRPIAMDPQIAFGRPVIASAGVTTQAVAARVDAGEELAGIAEDYGITVAEVEEAILVERAA